MGMRKQMITRNLRFNATDEHKNKNKGTCEHQAIGIKKTGGQQENRSGENI
jgi:hypothetical protein